MLNAVALKEEIMDDQAAKYSCGPAVTDHDWASTPPCGCPTQQLGNNEKAALLDAETGCSVTCNWCTAVIVDGKIVMEEP